MQVWVQGMITTQNSNYSAARSVQDNLQINWNDYGIDEEGPAADVESNYSVAVPETAVNLENEHFQQIQVLAREIKEAGDLDGVISFLVVLYTLQQLGY